MPVSTGYEMPFTADEFRERIEVLCAELQRARLDALICTSPESIYYLCGYEGYSYTDQQCIVVQADPPRTTLIIRDIDAPLANGDAGQACIDEMRPYRYPIDNPGALAWASLVRSDAVSLRVGVERVPEEGIPSVVARITEGVPSWASLASADNFVGRLRIRKRPAEMAYIRQAAVIAKEGLEAAFGYLRPGISEIDFASEIEYRLRKSGSQESAIPTLVESGPRTTAAHSMPTARVIREGEPVRFAFGAVRRRYHVTTYQSAFLGTVAPAYERNFNACREALDILREGVRAGVVMSAPCLAARKTLEKHGISHGNMGRWGYGVGIAFEPGWGEPYAINEYATDMFQPGMTFCLHVTMSLPEHSFGFTVGADYVLDPDGLHLINKVEPALRIIDI